MKKNGFTLAEVLITLAIIGVVAVLTLPALMTNTQEQQAKTALKKGINTLTEAAQTNQAIAGFDYASLTSDGVDNTEDQTLWALLANRANMNFQLSGTDTAAANSVNTGNANNAGENYVIFFRDGSALSVPLATTVMTEAELSEMQEDGLVYGFPAVYDTNGQKGPNILSNCEGGATMLAQDAHNDTVREGVDCTLKANRVIKDQFGVRLRGAFAVPNGSAARWAFEN